MLNEEQKFGQIINEYKAIEEAAEKDYFFYQDLLFNIKFQYGDTYFQKEIKDICIRTSKAILEERAKIFIKNEKLLFLLNDSLNQLYRFLIFNNNILFNIIIALRLFSKFLIYFLIVEN